MDPMVLYHLEYQYRLVLRVFGISIAIENIIQTELDHTQNTFNLIKEEILDLSILSSEKIVKIPFLDPTLKIDRVWETSILPVEFHWDDVEDLYLHQKRRHCYSTKSLWKKNNTILKPLLVQRTKVKSVFLALKGQTEQLQHIGTIKLLFNFETKFTVRTWNRFSDCN